jgi:hypothetical protein
LLFGPNANGWSPAPGLEVLATARRGGIVHAGDSFAAQRFVVLTDSPNPDRAS